MGDSKDSIVLTAMGLNYRTIGDTRWSHPSDKQYAPDNALPWRLRQ